MAHVSKVVPTVWLQIVIFKSSPLDTFLSPFHQYNLPLNKQSNRGFRPLRWLGWEIRTAGLWRWVMPDVSWQCSRLSSKVSMSNTKHSSRVPSWRFVPLRIRPVPFLETSGQICFSKFHLKFILTLFTCSFLKSRYFPKEFNSKVLYFYLPLLSTCLTTRISLDFKTLFRLFLFHSLMGRKKADFLSTFHSHCRDWYDRA